MAFGKRKINGFKVSQSLSSKELHYLKGGIGAAGWDDTDDAPTGEISTTGPSIGSAGWDEE